MLSLQKVICLFIVFGLLAVSLAGTPGSDAPGVMETPHARTESPSTDSHHSGDDTERTFEFNFGSDKVEARIQIRANGTESQLRHEVTAGDSGAEFRVEFQQESGHTENELRMRLRLFALVEYIPDSTPGYQNETILRTYRNWNWGSGFVDTTPNSTTSKVYTLKTVDNVFGLTLRVNRPVEGNLTFAPEDVKFDIELDADALRAAGWLNGTEVALKAALASRLESEKQHDNEDGQTENSINVGAAGAAEFGQLYFSWLNYIQCGVNKVSVVSSPLRVDKNQTDASDDADSTANVVAFAFINLREKSNTACIWDPVVSALRAVSPTGPSSKASGAVSLVGSLAVFATALLALF